MRIKHLSLAVLVTMIWGLNFSVIKIGLGSFDPFLLAALRFVIRTVFSRYPCSHCARHRRPAY